MIWIHSRWSRFFTTKGMWWILRNHSSFRLYQCVHCSGLRRPCFLPQEVDLIMSKLESGVYVGTTVRMWIPGNKEVTTRQDPSYHIAWPTLTNVYFWTYLLAPTVLRGLAGVINITASMWCADHSVLSSLSITHLIKGALRIPVLPSHSTFFITWSNAYHPFPY